MKYLVTRTIEQEVEAESLEDARVATMVHYPAEAAKLYLSITAIGE